MDYQKSNDNGSDVIAEKNNERISIQVKHSVNSINKFAVFQADAGRFNYKAEKSILVTNSEFTNQAKLYVSHYSVDLMDTHDISLYLRKNGSIKFTYKN